MPFSIAAWSIPTARVERARPHSLHLPLRGGAKVALHCAHRETTASSWGLCEQEGPWPLPIPHPSSLVISQGWGLIDLPLRAAFSPAHPLADIFHPPHPPIASQSISRDVPVAQARALQFSLPLLKGVAKAALYCAHRTSTVSPCAFCEQEGHLAAPCPPLNPLVNLCRRSIFRDRWGTGLSSGATS